jgi:hypothetical protein
MEALIIENTKGYWATSKDVKGNMRKMHGDIGNFSFFLSFPKQCGSLKEVDGCHIGLGKL